METIQLNGKEYINKLDLEKEYIKRSSIEEEYILKNNVEKTSFENMSINLTDEVNIMGMGSSELKGDWKICKVNIEYLEKAIHILKLMTCKKKRETIVIAITNEFPLCMGNIKKNIFSGVIIAPRIESD